MRLILVVAAATCLGACNMVVSQTPTFDRSDATGAPALRQGVWAVKSSTPCDFDPATPLDTWPSCSQGAVVGDGTVTGFQEKDGKQVRTTWPMVVVAGDPRIAQVKFDLSQDMPVAVSAYIYLGLRPTKSDAEGRIIAYRAWPVLCGPPPPAKETSDGHMRFGTLEPLPGLTMDRDGNDCTPNSKQALAGAAVASEAWAGQDVSEARWVRDGDR